MTHQTTTLPGITQAIMRRRNNGVITAIQKVWLTKDEAKAYIGCSDSFLQMLRDGALVSYSRYGNKMYWYNKDSIDKFIEKYKIV